MEKYHNNIQDQFGNAIPNVTVTVRENPGGGLASLFSDNGVSAKSNPFTNDTDGELFFYAENGRYDVELTGAITETKDDILLLDIAVTGNTLVVNTDIVTATPPTTELVTGNYEIFDLDGTDLLAQIGFNGSPHLRLANSMHGGNVRLVAQDTGGVARNIIDGNPDGATTLYYAGVIRARMDANGALSIRSETSTDTEARLLNLQHQDGTGRGYLGHNGNAILAVQNLINSGALQVRAFNSGGLSRTFLDGDPDALLTLNAPTDFQVNTNVTEIAMYATANGGVALYYDTILRLRTESSGRVAIRSDLSTDTGIRELVLAHQDGTARARLGHQSGSSILKLQNEIHGSATWIGGENAGASAVEYLRGLPDSTTVVVAATDVEIHVNATEDAITCVANGVVTLYEDGVAELRTAQHNAADAASGAEVKGPDGTFRYVGFNLWPRQNITGGDHTLGQGDQGKILFYNEATARSLLLNNDGNIPVDAAFMLRVGPTAGVLTGDGGAGVTITWWNGSGWTTTAAAANVTIGVGLYTIWKETDTHYYIDGPTIS